MSRFKSRRQPIARARAVLIPTLCAFHLAGSPAMAEPTGPAGPKPCQEAGSDQGVIEGRLGLLQGLGPAAFIVPLPGGLCLKGATASDSVEQAHSVQLYAASAAGMQQLYHLAGHRVIVHGRLTAGASYQLKAPILMEVIEIVAR